MTDTTLTRYGAINSYDLIKFLALVIMTIDHVGAYLYPHEDMLWLRAIGRLSFPVWLFLIGFSVKHHIRRDLIMVALIMSLVTPLTYIPVFPLNILVTIILVRLFLNVIDNRQLLQREPLMLWLAVTVFGLSTSVLCEYGSFALMYACLGYITRHGLQGWKYRAFYVLSYGFFVAWQIYAFGFGLWQSAFVSIGMAVICWHLYRFRVVTMDHAVPAILHGPIRYLARQSLYYYAAHRLLFQAIAAIWLMDASRRGITWIAWGG